MSHVYDNDYNNMVRLWLRCSFAAEGREASPANGVDFVLMYSAGPPQLHTRLFTASSMVLASHP